MIIDLEQLHGERGDRDRRRERARIACLMWRRLCYDTMIREGVFGYEAKHPAGVYTMTKKCCDCGQITMTVPAMGKVAICPACRERRERDYLLKEHDAHLHDLCYVAECPECRKASKVDTYA